MYHTDEGWVAVGLDIPPRDKRGRGYGKAALCAYMDYLFDKLDVDVLYTQTWSGNLPMISLAAKIGFAEVRRIKDLREVDGKRYDALTFAITREDFRRRHCVHVQQL